MERNKKKKKYRSRFLSNELKEDEEKKEEEKKPVEKKEDTKINKVMIDCLKNEFDTLIMQNRKEIQEYQDLKSAIGKAKSNEEIKIKHSRRRRIGQRDRSKENPNDNAEMKQINFGKKINIQKLSNFNREMRSFNVSPTQNRNNSHNASISFGKSNKISMIKSHKYSKERDDSKDIYNIVKGIRNLYLLKSSAIRFANNNTERDFTDRKASCKVLPKRELFIHKGEFLNETDIFERKDSEQSFRNNTKDNSWSPRNSIK